MHDPRKPGDLLKVGDDPLDDLTDSARYGLKSGLPVPPTAGTDRASLLPNQMPLLSMES